MPVKFTPTGEDGKEQVKEKEASTLSESGRRNEVDINTNKSSKLMMPGKDAVAKVQLHLSGLFSALCMGTAISCSLEYEQYHCKITELIHHS